MCFVQPFFLLQKVSETRSGRTVLTLSAKGGNFQLNSMSNIVHTEKMFEIHRALSENEASNIYRQLY